MSGSASRNDSKLNLDLNMYDMYMPKVIIFNAKDERAAERFTVIANTLKFGGESREEIPC